MAEFQNTHNSRHHSTSRWHNFHFSGKVIMCSVLLGFMLILIGSIVLVIGMDRQDGDTKTDNYEDIQKKAPMSYVGPIIMGIGGFSVFVGITMCLIETNVCRKKKSDSRPLISGHGEETAVKNLDMVGKGTEPAIIPSTSKHRRGYRKKSPSPRKHKKPHKEKSLKESDSNNSVQNNSKSQNFISGEKFLTPPSSFVESNVNSTESQNLTENTKKDSNAKSLLKSFTSSGPSWNASSEYQTPATSFIDNSFEFQQSCDSQVSESSTPVVYEFQASVHEYLTPQNSDAEKYSAPVKDLKNTPETESAQNNVRPDSSSDTHFEEKTESCGKEIPKEMRDEYLDLKDNKCTINEDVINQDIDILVVENETENDDKKTHIYSTQNHSMAKSEDKVEADCGKEHSTECSESKDLHLNKTQSNNVKKISSENKPSEPTLNFVSQQPEDEGSL